MQRVSHSALSQLEPETPTGKLSNPILNALGHASTRVVAGTPLKGQPCLACRPIVLISPVFLC